MWSVTGARNWQAAAGRWQLSKGQMKAQAAWKEMFFYFFLPVERWTGARRTGDGHRGCPNQPHISGESHLLDRGPLTQSLRVPEEPPDSSSARPPPYQASATDATSSLWARLLCMALGTSPSVRASLRSWRNSAGFDGFGASGLENGRWEVYVWSLEMSQSASTPTWRPETTTTTWT